MPPSSIAIGTTEGLPAGGLGSSLFEASEDCVKVIGLDGSLQAMNVNGVCLMEVDDFDALKNQPWASLWPQAHRATIEAAVEAARQGLASRFFADCPTAKGAPKSWDVTVAPVLDDEGRPMRIVSISRDVTEKQRVEAQNELLVRELAHRIKNMFAVVDGVISISARASPEAKPFAQALRDRLFGLGRAIAYVAPPELIGRDATAEYTLHGLLRVLLEPYGVGDAEQRISIKGDDLKVGRTATTSIALFAHELATNALKYGALRGHEGRVHVSTRLSPGEIELVWEEIGEGVPPPRTLGSGEGFGATLLDNAVIRQLRGRITRAWGKDGLMVAIDLPTERLGF